LSKVYFWGPSKDSLLLTHGLSPMTGQHGGHYDPQPVTRSTD